VANPGARLLITVADDGNGFDLDAARPGFGLMGMRERVKVLDGTCRIHSARGQGTRIEVGIPLPAPAEGVT
jgi:signal transduction histidine kinase